MINYVKFIILFFLSLVFSCNNNNQSSKNNLENSELKINLVSKNLQKQISGLNIFNPQNLNLAKKLLKKEDPTIRILVLNRISSWKFSQSLPIYLEVLQHNKFAMVREKSLDLIWNGKETIDKYHPLWKQIMQATLLSLNDKFLLKKSAGILKKHITAQFLPNLQKIISQTSEDNLPVLFDIFCSFAFTPSDVKFILKYKNKLGFSKKKCQQKVSEAITGKFIKSDTR